MSDQYFTSSARGNEILEDVDDVANRSPNFSNLKFRNYTPQTQFLKGLYELEISEPKSIIPFIQDKLDLISSNSDDINNDNSNEDNENGGTNNYKVDPEMLEPKKIDWDLKRRLEKRAEKLERETNKQIDNYVKNQRSKTKQ